MRIAIISPPWVPVPPPAYGGTEAVLDTLARGLHDAGHDVVLFATGDSTCPVPRDHVIELATGVGMAGSATELRHVIGAYDRVRDADVIHDHTLIGPVYSDRFDGPPVVTTNHGPFIGELGDYYRAIADRVPIIAISHHQAKSAPDIPVAAVIHHGVDVDLFPVGEGEGGYALFLGRMHPSKGADRAVRIAREAGVPLKIAAKCSEPLERAYFTERVEPLLGGDIEFVGEVGLDRKLGLLAGATCLLNPIDWPEPFGMVMIEALACGTPVVTTPLGAAPEIVDEGVTGYFGDDEAALANALGKVDQLDRAACRAATVERFSARRMVDDHVALYTRLAESKVGAPTLVA